jgi:hypothetical protein
MNNILPNVKNFNITPLQPDSNRNADLLEAAKMLGIKHKIIYTSCEAGGIAIHV